VRASHTNTPGHSPTNPGTSQPWPSRVRNLLTHNREDLSQRRFAKMWNTLVDLGDPGYDILAAYIAKEKLRDLLALARTGPDRDRISQRLFAFYDWCAHTGLPEIERLATTIEQWWPCIEAFLHTGITNAASEGVNRVVKLAARNAYGRPQPHQPTPPRPLRHHPPSTRPPQARLTSETPLGYDVHTHASRKPRSHYEEDERASPEVAA
jgi:Transposase